MTKLSRKVCSHKKFIFAILFALLVVVSFMDIEIVQSGYRSSSLVLTVTEETSNVTVHYIDVGQGDSILIDTQNEDVLIDGGPPEAATTILSHLNSLNMTRIHLMIATHVHEDHIGGLVDVLNSTIDVDEILINNQTCTTDVCVDFMSLAQMHTITVAQRGQTFQLTETANLTMFNPVQPLEFASANDNSIVIKLQVGNTSFLFTGDAEADAEQSMLDAGLDLQSNILKVGHHGSKTSTTQPFLDSVSPSYAIISAGRSNLHGHPDQEVLQRLLGNGVTIYGTYELGTIIASTDGTSISIIPEFPSSIILPILMITTLLGVIVQKKKHSTKLKKQRAQVMSS